MPRTRSASTTAPDVWYIGTALRVPRDQLREVSVTTLRVGIGAIGAVSR